MSQSSRWLKLVAPLVIVGTLVAGVALSIRPANSAQAARSIETATTAGAVHSLQTPAGVQGPFVSERVYPAVFNGDLRDLPQLKPQPRDNRLNQRVRPVPASGNRQSSAAAIDPLVQTSNAGAHMPSPDTTFAGMNYNANGAGWPPDTNGDVGPNHYIQMVNSSIGIYSKTTGTPLAVLDLDTFFNIPSNTICDNNNQGDPVVVYDTMADRWLVSDFAWSNSTDVGPYYECLAISQTGDPVSGGWYFYAFLADSTIMNDYPKFGVWPDAYYLTANMFPDAGGFDGVYVWAFNRAAMLAGSPLTTVKFTTGPAYGGLLPSNLRGAQPPAGSPNYLLALDSGGLAMWKFHVDFTTPLSSTFTGPISIDTAPYIQPAGEVPQQGTTNSLDSLGDRLMMQLQYRNINGVESLWAAHTVDTGSTYGVRWYEVRGLSTAAPSVYQQGTYQPDSLYRWMPSLAVDRQGNMAVGYSVSSGSMFPAIRYAGRLAGDPLNLLPQGEATLYAGTGSQTAPNRWGDYSAMSVDPVDDCTFWYTNEYLATTGTNWQTRIGSFKFPLCTNAAQSITGTVIDGITLLPVTNTFVAATNGANQSARQVNDAVGHYRFQLPTGSYTLTALAYGYVKASIPNVTVSPGVTTVRNITLTLAATHILSGQVTDARTGWPLYAQVNVSGYPVPYPGNSIWTDPVTGFYTLTLPEGISITLSVDAWVPGYQAGNAQPGLLTTDQTLNFALLNDPAACSAPGYAATIATQQDFEGSNGGYSGSTPWAWGTPTSGPNAAHSGTKVWATNLTGNYGISLDAALTSAAMNLSAYTGKTPIVQWWQWLQTETGFDFAYLEVSKDGTNYSGVYTATGDVALSWAQKGVALDPSYATANFRARFRLTSDGSVNAPGWYVDDVRILVACDPQAGGLVVGNVYSQTTASPIAGATIAGDAGQSTTSQATPGDAANPDSFYTLFSPAGLHTFTATLPTLATLVSSTTVPVSNTTRLDFVVEVNPGYLVYLPLILR
jgi:hypothetical protein